MADKNGWRELHKEELVQYVASFYQTSWNWRNAKYHSDWDTYERNYKNIYDPAIKAKKEPWQATMFDPMTVTNCEIIDCSLTRLLFGRKQPIRLEPREMGDQLQAELNTSILDYEVEKSGFVASFHGALREAVVYGNGFLKFFWHREYAPRRVRREVPAIENVAQVLSSIMQFRKPDWKNMEEVVDKVLIKNNVAVEKVHIRDIFLEPNSTDLKKVLQRRKLSFGELKKLADEKMLDKDSVDSLRTLKESDSFEQDLSTIRADEGITDPNHVTTDYDKKHTAWEFWGHLPKKWIYLEMPEETDKQREEANELIPGRALIASGKFYLGSEENMIQSMEPPFVKVPYIPSGGTYDIGVAQLIRGLQEEASEIRNLRVDNATLALNKVFAVLEKGIVDVNEVKSKPGAIFRIKSSVTDDVRKAFAEIPVSDIPISAFRETGELERKAQEVTAANRVTMGTAGLTQDTNQTLGGMELLRQAANDRFNVYAFYIGMVAVVPSAMKIMELSYQNMDQERLRRILGEMPVEYLPNMYEPKWRLYKPLPPHELIMAYDFKFVDIFGMENRQQKHGALASTIQLMSSTVSIADPKPLFDKLLTYDEFAPEERADILKALQGPQPTALGLGQGVPSIAKQGKVATGEVAPPEVPMMGPG